MKNGERGGGGGGRWRKQGEKPIHSSHIFVKNIHNHNKTYKKKIVSEEKNNLYIILIII